MGIKGIYGEIGPGERTSLSKLAIEKIETACRPLRIAIDISIWQFQIQAGQGGSNPAIRTLYYRLLRLLSVSVQPLFVFDGRHKPPFKRGKKTGQSATVSDLITKQLLKLFGFPFHTAPGEAEAECALLQKEGIVDAVLSEDVDTLMFGCGLTFRNWSSEGSRGNKSPTHVSVYDAKVTKHGKSGLDREGMVLVALMSGGDYIPEGIPGCGIKVACEAARAGYGKSLCQISRKDSAGLAAWRAEFVHELTTNESRHFRIKHKSLKIPDDFPNKEVLGYYTHPVVSSSARLQELKVNIEWDGEVDVVNLRAFVAEAFNWTHKVGATKFVRGLAPALLVHKLRHRGERRDSGYGDVVLTAMEEMELVRAICGQRSHFSTDGVPELRVVYRPLDIVVLDLEKEEDDIGDHGRDGLAPMLDDDQIESYASDELASRSVSPTKKAMSSYDPSQPDKLWIPHTIAKLGVPLRVEDYEESLRDPRKFLKQKAAAKRATTKGGMPKGALDRFVQASKPPRETGAAVVMKTLQEVPIVTTPSALPPVFLAPTLEDFPSTQRVVSGIETASRASKRLISASTSTKSTINKISRKAKSKTAAAAVPNANPWTLSLQTSSPTSAPNITKALLKTSKPSTSPGFRSAHSKAIDLVSSSPAPASEPSSPRKHRHSPSPTFPHEIDPEDNNDLELAPLPSTVTKTRRSKYIGKAVREADTDFSKPSAKKKKALPRNAIYGIEDSRRNRRSMTEPPGHDHVHRLLQADLDHSMITSEAHASLPGLGVLNAKINNHDVQNSARGRRRARSSSPALPWPILKLTTATTDLLPSHSNISPFPTNAAQNSRTASPSNLQLPQTTSHAGNDILLISPATQSDKQPNQPNITRKPKVKKVLTLRESIGAWQILDEESGVKDGTGACKGNNGKDRDRRGRKIFRESQVERLDLTGWE